MKQKFILVNGRILDLELYREEFHILSAAIKPEVFELATKYGLQFVKIGKASDFGQKAVFYSQQLDMELAVSIRKKSKMVFV